MSDCVESNRGTAFPLQILPTEVLFLIFQLCDISSLGRLASTCKRFNDVIDDDYFWQEKSKNVIITNQLSERLRRRTYSLLIPKERCRISENWKRGRYKESIHKRQTARFMPWLVLEKDYLWLSQGPYIVRLVRSQHTLNAAESFEAFNDHKDVCRFVKRDDYLVCGGRDGVLSGWSTDGYSQLFCHRLAHSKDVCAVDCTDSVIVSGGSDHQLKIWPRMSMHDNCDCSFEVNIGEKILCLSIDPSDRLLSLGTAAVQRVAPLHLYDLHTRTKLVTLPSEWKKGAGILDIEWLDNHSLLTGSYDTSITMWDLRVQDAVMIWENPFDSAVYCIQTDGENAIVSGLAHSCCMQLWDKRVPNRLVQIYYAKSADSSPVYSLAFDSSVLFCALDRSLRSFNFTGRSNKPKNYKACLGQSVPAGVTRNYITRSA